MEETKGQLIDRQITIKEKEIALHAETQKLLFDLLSRMTPEQKSKLRGYNIDDGYCSIDGNCSSDGFDVTDDDGNSFYHPIDDLRQTQQKDLVDFILCNNLID